MSALPARGELWWCELPEIGRRPVVVLSRAAASTSTRRTMHDYDPSAPERGRPGARDDPIPHRWAVNLDSVESVSVVVLVRRLGRLADARMREICGALEVAGDCQG